jgi:putative transposase
VEEVLHWPYLKGLSASTVSRCPCLWEQEHEEWNSRNLQKNRYVYFWADGVYFNIRSDDARQCILVIVGVTDQGRKEFVAIEDGYRESEKSWTELLLRLRAHGLKQGSKPAIGDGALGFWKAMDKVYPDARHQRCRVRWSSKNGQFTKQLDQEAALPQIPVG